ncbi:hypothetical protein IWW56_000144 [Coemansia sp. RSA 2131]|nr:hypothetical protein IWW56_000144 [Coemansia sp. RSA 2131]
MIIQQLAQQARLPTGLPVRPTGPPVQQAQQARLPMQLPTGPPTGPPMRPTGPPMQQARLRVK